MKRWEHYAWDHELEAGKLKILFRKWDDMFVGDNREMYWTLIDGGEPLLVRLVKQDCHKNTKRWALVRLVRTHKKDKSSYRGEQTPIEIAENKNREQANQERTQYVTINDDGGPTGKVSLRLVCEETPNSLNSWASISRGGFLFLS